MWRLIDEAEFMVENLGLENLVFWTCLGLWDVISFILSLNCLKLSLIGLLSVAMGFEYVMRVVLVVLFRMKLARVS